MPLTDCCNASEESTHDLDSCFKNAQSPLSFNHTVLLLLWRNSADSMSFVLFFFSQCDYTAIILLVCVSIRIAHSVYRCGDTATIKLAMPLL